MDRKRFIKTLGIGAVAIFVMPVELLAERTPAIEEVATQDKCDYCDKEITKDYCFIKEGGEIYQVHYEHKGKKDCLYGQWDKLGVIVEESVWSVEMDTSGKHFVFELSKDNTKAE